MLDFPAAMPSSPAAPSWFPISGAILRTKGRIEIEIPFNAPKDRPTRLFIDETGDLFGSGIHSRNSPSLINTPCRAMPSPRAVLEGGEVPVPLEGRHRQHA